MTDWRARSRQSMAQKAGDDAPDSPAARGSLLRHFDRIYPVRIKSEVTRDLFHAGIRIGIAPDRILHALVARFQAEVGGIALVGTVRLVLGRLEEAHLGILARD